MSRFKKHKMTAKQKREADWIWEKSSRSKNGKKWNIYRDSKTGIRQYVTISDTGRPVIRYNKPW